MRPAHGVLAVRLAVYGLVAVLGLIVWQLRAHEPKHGTRFDRPVNGRTSQDLGVWAIVRDDAVQVVEIAWHFTCIDGVQPPAWASRFDARRETFQRDGREFSVERLRDIPEADGWIGHSHASVAGAVSEDGRSASGTGQVVVTWTRGAERSPSSCDTGPVRWSVRR